MSELFELVLINRKGQVLARALELSSVNEANDFANQWNGERSRRQAEGYWIVSRIEGRVV